MSDNTENNSENQNTGDNPPVEDPIKNLKSEFARKNDNVLRELEGLKQQLGIIADSAIQAAAATKQRQQASDDQEIDPVMDPKGYAKKLEEKITRQMEEKMTKTMSSQASRQTELSQLVSQYPELQSGDSELTKTAVQIYNNLSEDEKQSKSAYRLAVATAAQELGVLPVNKRKQTNQNSEDFTVNQSSTNRPNRSTQKEQELDERTTEFARLLGRPVDDKKYQESLKKAANRKNWKKYT